MIHRVNLTDKDYFKLMELKGKYGQKTISGLLIQMDAQISTMQTNTPFSETPTNISDKQIRNTEN